MSACLWSVLLVVCAAAVARGAIVASSTDFTVDCGPDVGGPVSITYNNADRAPVPVKMYSRNNLGSCAVTSDQATNGVFTLSDVRSNCDVALPDPTQQNYFIQLTLQEISGIRLSTDPVFNIECQYKAGVVTTSSATLNIGETVIPTSIVVDAVGNPNMIYSLNLLDSLGATATDASFGDLVVLEVTMSGTDFDEQSLRVENCTASSGSASITFVDNGCLVTGLTSLSNLPGFMTSGMRAFLPFTLFTLEGGSASELQFECTVNVCDASCDGQNCGATGRRRRRAAGDGTEDPKTDKSLTLAREVQLVPVGFYPASSQTGQNNESTGSCFQSMGFIITVVVMGILLLAAMVIAVALVNARRRDFQKSTA